MKTISRFLIGSLGAAALILTGCSLDSSSSDKGPTGPTLTSSVTAPTDLLLAGTAGSVSIAKGYNNDYSGTLGLALVDKEADTGYVPLVASQSGGADVYTGDWTDTGLSLGTKSLYFDFANVAGGAADSGHVVVSFKDIAGLSRAGKTGFTFTLKLLDAPADSAIGLMPHLRVHDAGAADPDNVVTFAYEMWYYKTDKAYMELKIPFASFTKPGYGKQTETSIAALSASTEFNQIDFDIRVAPVAAGKFLANHLYTAILDKVGYY